MTNIDELVARFHEALESGRLDEAERRSHELMELDPDGRDARMARALVLAEQGRGEEAIEAMEAVLDVARDDTIALFSLAGLLLDVRDDPDEALPALEAVWETVSADEAREPEHVKPAMDALRVQVLVRIAQAREKLGDVDGAMEAAQEAHARQGGDLSVKLTLANALFGSGRVLDAQRQLEGLVQENPAAAGAWWMLGRVRGVLGDEAGCNQAIARATRENPEGFAAPPRLERAAFEKMMARVVAGLPKPLQGFLQQNPPRVAFMPTPEMLANTVDRVESHAGVVILGAPPEEDVASPRAVKADAVWVFQRNLELLSDDEGELEENLRGMLMLEMARFLGMQDAVEGDAGPDA